MKPTPINKHIVCSACGLNWEMHGEKPTLETCVGLLKKELAARPKFQSHQIMGTAGTAYYPRPLQ